ncbi:MAG: apolipoprotein N-acyltransferase [Treponema sp.]|nr:apolipoprotein N-acyltransferase [Treponema sp.]
MALITGLLSQPSLLFENGLFLLAWTAFIPLFILLENISIKSSALYGFAYGLLFYYGLCWWFSSFGFIALSFVAFLHGFYFALVFFLIAWSKKVFPKRFSSLHWLFRVFILLSFDFIRSRGMLGFSYGICAYSQWHLAPMLKFASFFGVNGVSFLIYSFNSILAKIIYEKDFSGNLKKLSFFLSLIVSILILNLLPEKEGKVRTLHYALIQNASSASSSTIDDYVRDFELLKSLTDKALESEKNTELVVWPETSVVPDIIYHLKHTSDYKRHSLALSLVEYIKSKNISFITGNNFLDGDGVHNAALFFTPDGGVEFYLKNHLVPFTECWPDFLDSKVFDGIKKRLNCEFFAPGKEVRVFKMKALSLAVPICFEDSFSPLLAEMKALGADIFVNISDDAWAHSVAAQNIHASMSVFRSAEYGTATLRSTIDGKSCMIDWHGKIIEELSPGIDSFLAGKLSIPENSRTLYSFTGDFIYFVLTLATISFLLILLVLFVKVKVYG